MRLLAAKRGGGVARVNLFVNPRFAVNTTGWNASGATLTRVASGGPDDEPFGRVDDQDGYGNFAFANDASGVNLGLPPGDFTISFDARINAGDGAGWSIRSFCLDGAYNVLEAADDEGFTPTGSWARYAVHGTAAHASTQTLRVDVVNTGAGTDILDITRLVLEAGNIVDPTWFEGV